MTRNDISYLTYLRLLLITKITRAIISLLRSIPHSLGGRLYTPPTRTFTIPSSKDPSYQRKIMINVYEPPQMWEGMTDGLKPRPVHINFHGSGYILPLLGQDSEFCAHLARSLNVIVLDADYAKAPEYPFPFPYYDVEDVLSHVLSSDQIYDTSRVTMSGFSAGGALALSVAGCSPVARDKVKGVIAFYPAVDFTKKGKKFDQTVPPPPPPPIHPPPPKQPWFKGRFPPFVSNFFVDCYLSPTQDRTDPRLSPCFITPSNLPPLLLFTADIDTLSKPAIRFAETLKEAGRDVRLRNFVGVGHGWDKLANPPSKGYEYKVEAYDMSVAFLKELYEEVPQSKL